MILQSSSQHVELMLKPGYDELDSTLVPPRQDHYRITPSPGGPGDRYALRDPMVQSLSHVNVKSATVYRGYKLHRRHLARHAYSSCFTASPEPSNEPEYGRQRSTWFTFTTKTLSVDPTLQPIVSPSRRMAVCKAREEPKLVYGYAPPSPYGTVPAAYGSNGTDPRVYEENTPSSRALFEDGEELRKHLSLHAPIPSPSVDEEQRGMRWRDPNLTEVIGFLNNPNNVIKANAAAYLQHLCYMDDPNKQKTRSLGGIPPLVMLLNHDSPDVYRNACGALRHETWKTVCAHLVWSLLTGLLHDSENTRAPQHIMYPTNRPWLEIQLRARLEHVNIEMRRPICANDCVLVK
uniref:Uncharacterized protein n=1 Tax=Timema bartmani TaxID=61472 RepID=A0A7R9EPG9_9NEOP|nr:unnamed protein product [Timema bartmani]